jgi:hypothetical protein
LGLVVAGVADRGEEVVDRLALDYLWGGKGGSKLDGRGVGVDKRVNDGEEVQRWLQGERKSSTVLRSTTWRGVGAGGIKGWRKAGGGQDGEGKRE